MKKFLHIFLMLTFALPAFAQFDDLGVTVSADGTLTFPSAATFRLKNDIASKSDIPVLKTLLFGTGLNGISYNGGAEVTTSVNTSWLTSNYHKTLTRGTGLLGDNYNGTATATWSIDASYIKGLMPTLTRGTGLTGVNYNGNTASTFAVDTAWLVTNYHKDLTPQNGLQLTSGTTYNGQVARNVQVDKTYVRTWLNSLQKDFFLFVEMSPTPQDTNTFDTKSTSQTNVFYYKYANSLTYTATNATTSGVTVPLANASNVMHSTTSTVPTSYVQSNFTTSTLSASLSGNIVYDKATSINYTTARTVNSVGNVLSSYTTSDKVIAMRYWTDCEMKVIDKWGNILYFTSTIGLNFSDVKALHPEVTDSNPTIWFFGSYGYTGCYGIKTKFTNFNSSIGSTIGSSNTITGVWIYPNIASTETRTVKVWSGYQQQSGTRSVVWGKYIREVMENPENNIIVWRQTTSQGELFSGQKLWRPVLPTYYGDFKEAN